MHTNEKGRVEAARLDIKCLKLLRALVHNKERLLPENWEADAKAHQQSVHSVS